MIIEAAPRLWDGSLEGYTPSPRKTEPNKITFGRQLEGSKTYIYKLENSGDLFVRNKLNDSEKTRADLLDSKLKKIQRSRNRRSLNRDHPYKDKTKGKRGTIALDHLFSEYKRPTLFRPFHREKIIDILHKFSFNLKQRTDKRGNKRNCTTPPIFTANANENNDNSPCTNQCSGGFDVTKHLLKSSALLSEDDICDVEIEDIATTSTPEQFSSCDEAYMTCRQRRKSLNTNPLSSTAEIHNHFSFEDLVTCSSRNQTENVTGIEQEGKSSYVADLKFLSSPDDKNCETFESDSCAPSFEKLLAFFEPNIATLPASDSITRKSPKSSWHSSRSSLFRESFEPSLSKKSSLITTSPTSLQNNHEYQVLRRASKTPLDNRSPHTSSGNLEHVIHKDLESVIQITARHVLHPPTSSPAGVLYNNNGNAASAPPQSSLVWPERNCTSSEEFSLVGRYDLTLRRKAATLPSPCSFPGKNGRCLSTLSQFSPQTESSDLESNRLSHWSGSRPATATSFDRRKQKCSFPFDNLISLQTPSQKSSYWIGGNESGLSTQNVKQTSSFHTSFSRKNEKRGEEFESGSCRVRTKEIKTVCLSANNHHNAPWFSPEDRSCEDIREKRLSFENFQLHSTLFEPFLGKTAPFGRNGEMGCIQSIAKAKVSPDRCHHSVIVEDIQAAIDRTPTEIEEKSPIVLRYRTPYFRASAHVIVPPIPRKETWTVGWIQACDSMKFINQYGNLGSSSWEIPALKDRRISAVSDSDGVSYPWYGNTTEIATVEGPTETSRSLTLRMNDNFYPSVTWDVPVSEGSEAHLTHIVRDQSFTTWLAAVNQTTGRLEVLRTVKWHFYLEIDVDPTQELGKRARIVSPLVQKQPIILKNNSEPVYLSSPHRSAGSSAGIRQKRLNRRPGAGGDNNSNNHTNYIPKSALVRPSANNAQTLIWRPARDVPVIVVPAKEEYKENNEVVWFTRTPTMHGQDHNVRVLSLQEMSQLKKSIS